MYGKLLYAHPALVPETKAPEPTVKRTKKIENLIFMIWKLYFEVK
tara:strand:+ start:364 stop:498 length:135 start_codon:yes stop_codon:yes gene_type:complete